MLHLSHIFIFSSSTGENFLQESSLQLASPIWYHASEPAGWLASQPTMPQKYSRGEGLWGINGWLPYRLPYGTPHCKPHL